MNAHYTEANPFSSSGGNFSLFVQRASDVIEFLPGSHSGSANKADSASQQISQGKVVSTDPPYYDNIGYADFSDFFYVWLRRALRSIYPEIFSTLATPKAEELVASAHRHGSKVEAEAFFLSGMTGGSSAAC